MKKVNRWIALALAMIMFVSSFARLPLHAEAAELETLAPETETLVPETETLAEADQETVAQTVPEDEQELPAGPTEETAPISTAQMETETAPEEEMVPEDTAEAGEPNTSYSALPDVTASENEMVSQTFSQEAVSDSAETEISQEDFETALAEAGYSWYYLGKSLTLSSDLTITSEQNVYITRVGSITVPDGKTLTLDGGKLEYVYGKIIIESGGVLIIKDSFWSGCKIRTEGCLTAKAGSTLVLSAGGITVDGGTLTVENGAVLQTDGRSHVENNFGGSTISGVPMELIYGDATPKSFSDLREALLVGKNYSSLQVSLQSSMTVNENIEIPDNASVRIYGDAVITVSSDTVITNNGSLSVSGDSQLCIQEGASLSNLGSLTVTAPAELTGEERVAGNAVLYEGYTTQEKFEKTYAVALGSYSLESSFTLTSDLVLNGVELTLNSRGKITVPEGLTLTVATSLKIDGGSIVVEPGGKLVISDGTELSVSSTGTLIADGGTVSATPGCIRYYDYNSGGGILSGIPREYVCISAIASSFANLKTMLADSSGYAAYTISVYGVTLGENVTIPSNVILKANMLTVPAGMTLTNFGSIYADIEKALTIEESGILDNQGVILVGANGSVSGSVTGNEILYGDPDTDPEEPDDGAATMTQNEFEKAVLTESSFTLTKSVVYTTDSLLNREVTIGNGGSVTIPAGVTVELSGVIYIEQGGTLTIEQGGALRIPGESVVYSGCIFVRGGTLIVEDGGTLSMEIPSIYYYSGELKGIPGDLIQAYSTVANCTELEEAIRTGEAFLKHTINLGATLVIDRDLTIPENVFLNYNNSGYSFTFQTDTVLTNNGKIQIYNGTIQNGAKVINNGTITLRKTLDVEAGGILQNYGTITVNDYGSAVKGTVEGNQPVKSENSYGITVTTFSELKAAAERPYSDSEPVSVAGTISIEDNLSLPYYMYLSIEDGGEILVPNGTVLMNEGYIFVEGKLTVNAGGKLVNNGGIYIDYVPGTNGTVRVMDGGSYTAGTGSTLCGDSERILGIDKTEISKESSASSEEELRALLDGSGYGSMLIWLEDIVLTSDLTVPANDVYLSGGSITVPSGITLTVEGRLADTVLMIQNGGKLVIRNGGFVKVDSEEQLVIDDSADLSIEPGGIHLNTGNGCKSLSSIPANLIYAECYIDTMEEWEALIAACAHYYHIDVTPRGGALAITKDMTIPSNMTLKLREWNGKTSVTVLEGVNLTNEGVIEIDDGAAFLIQSGGTVTNKGQISVIGAGQLIVNGQLVQDTQTYETVPMYRLFNPNSGEHFYTGSEVERDNLVNVGWNYEGVAWNAPVYIGEPVYRMFNPNSGDHHYTMSLEEKENLQNIGWQYENVAWNSAPADHEESVAQYRLYNPNADLGCHHYTSSQEERQDLVDKGWNLEGIGWFGLLR